MRPKIKICGITGGGDALRAARCGADYIGMVCEIVSSPRCITRAAAAELTRSSPVPVIVLVDKPTEEVVDLGLEVRPYGLQLIGQHSPGELDMIRRKTGCRIWLPVRIPEVVGAASGDSRRHLEMIAASSCDTVIIDTLVSGMKGGTGRTCDWALAEKIAAASRAPVFLAGGITPQNAAAACLRVRPAGLDVSSGVEASPGVKDRAKMEKLIAEIRTLKL